jgi:hypothetical protein
VSTGAQCDALFHTEFHTVSNMDSNTICNISTWFSTVFHNVFEVVVRTRQGASGQWDTSLAPGAIQRANGEIVEKCRNPGDAEGAMSGRGPDGQNGQIGQIDD